MTDVQPKSDQIRCEPQFSVVFSCANTIFPEAEARRICSEHAPIKQVRVSQKQENYKCNETTVEFNNRADLVKYYKAQQLKGPILFESHNVSFKMMRQQDYLVVLIHLPSKLTTLQLQQTVEAFVLQRAGREISLLVDIFNVKEFTAMGNVQLTNQEDFQDVLRILQEPHFTNAIGKVMGMSDFVVIDKETKERRVRERANLVGVNEICSIIASKYEGKNERERAMGKINDFRYNDRRDFRSNDYDRRSGDYNRPDYNRQDFPRQLPVDYYREDDSHRRNDSYGRLDGYNRPPQDNYTRPADYPKPQMNDYDRPNKDYQRPNDYPRQNDGYGRTDDYRRPDEYPRQAPPQYQYNDQYRPQGDFRRDRDAPRPDQEISTNSVFVAGVVGATEQDVGMIFSSYGVDKVITLPQREGDQRTGKSYIVLFKEPGATEAVLSKRTTFTFRGQSIIVNVHKRTRREGRNFNDNAV